MARKKRAEDKQVATIKQYKITFGSEDGKDVLYNLMKTCGMFTTSFDTNSHQTAFNEGQRNVVLHIMNKLKMDHVALAKFIAERERE